MYALCVSGMGELCRGVEIVWVMRAFNARCVICIVCIGSMWGVCARCMTCMVCMRDSTCVILLVCGVTFVHCTGTGMHIL